MLLVRPINAYIQCIEDEEDEKCGTQLANIFFKSLLLALDFFMEQIIQCTVYMELALSCINISMFCCMFSLLQTL